MSREKVVETADRSSIREQLVARRVDPARVRAEEHVQKFLDAALELMSNSATGMEFTVAEVVETSGQSLRSFYQYFAGKQELLLALFEEDVRATTEHLRSIVSEEATPLDRLHRFVVEYYRLCRPEPRRRAGGKNWPIVAIAEFAQHLFMTQPAEAARAFASLVGYFERLLEEAERDGTVRAGMPPRRIAGIVIEAVMFNSFSTTLSGAAGTEVGDPAEELWDFVLKGISP